jgi:hypothetical protein
MNVGPGCFVDQIKYSGKTFAAPDQFFLKSYFFFYFTFEVFNALVKGSACSEDAESVQQPFAHVF